MRALKYLLLLVVALLLLGIGVLAVNGSVRHTVFRSAAELPGITTYFRLRATLVRRDFTASARLLAAQLDLVEGFSDGQNSLLPGLVTNTQYVLREVSLKHEGVALLPFLERLAAYRPNLFLAHLWLAEAALYTDPKRALEAARTAQKLIPSDDRPYRVAAQAALALGDTATLRGTCAVYATATLGGYHPYEYNTLFGGIGIRNFGLEIPGEDGKSYIVRHGGLTIGDRIAYPFTLSSAMAFENLTFHFGVPPGIRLKVHGVHLFKGGAQVANIAAKGLTLSARHGVFSGKALVTTSRDGEVLNINLGQMIEADQVQLILSVGKLPLIATEGCLTD